MLLLNMVSDKTFLKIASKKVLGSLEICVHLVFAFIIRTVSKEDKAALQQSSYIVDQG